MDSPVRGVVLDWCGTLVHPPTYRERLALALRSAGRMWDDCALGWLQVLEHTVGARDVAMDDDSCELLSGELFVAAKARLFSAVGIPAEVVAPLCATFSDLSLYPFYRDVGAVLDWLGNRGIRLVVGSNIHFDIRPQFRSAGFDRYIGGYVLSFEVGVEKPSRKFFEKCCEAMDVSPSDTLMVGDSWRLDGAARYAGLRYLVLDTPQEFDASCFRSLVDVIGGMP